MTSEWEASNKRKYVLERQLTTPIVGDITGVVEYVLEITQIVKLYCVNKYKIKFLIRQ